VYVLYRGGEREREREREGGREFEDGWKRLRTMKVAGTSRVRKRKRKKKCRPKKLVLDEMEKIGNLLAARI